MAPAAWLGGSLALPEPRPGEDTKKAGANAGRDSPRLSDGQIDRAAMPSSGDASASEPRQRNQASQQEDNRSRFRNGRHAQVVIVHG